MTRRKKKAPDEEEEPPKISSPGFCKHGFVFEQIKGGQFAQGETDNLPTEYMVGDKTYVPIDGFIPWPLAEDALDYGSMSDLTREVRQYIYDHVFLPHEELYDVVTSWALATWVLEIWNAVPYLSALAPKGTGKSRLLEALQPICYRGIGTGNITTAALFRISHRWHPTIFIDETAIYTFKGKGEIMHLLNSGYRRGKPAIRMRGEGAAMEVAFFDVFGFKALAGKRSLIDTLESRCIMIRMLKNAREVTDEIDHKRATILRGKLLQMRFNTLALSDVPDVHDVFLGRVPLLNIKDGRLKELFRPLLAITNDGQGNILRYMYDVYEAQQLEEKAGIEAELIAVVSRLPMTKHMVHTKDITVEFNQNRLENDKWNSRNLGWIMKRLGFERRRDGKARGWYINPKRLQSLQYTYGVKPILPLPGETSSTAETTETSKKEPVMKECFFCGKPIWTQDWKADEFTQNKPAHKHCYDEQKAKLKGGKDL